MQHEPSFRDDVITALVAFGTGSVVGLGISWPTGFVAYLLIGNECSGQHMCDLGAAIWAMIIGLSLGAVAFAAAAGRSLSKHCAPARRLRTGLMTFLGVPVFLLLLFTAGGLG